MGFFSSLLPIAGTVLGNMVAPGIGGAIGGALGGALGGGSGNKQTGAQQTNNSGTQNGSQNSTQSETKSSTSSIALDPAIARLLGTSGGGGLLGGLAGSLNGGSNLAPASNSFLNANAGQILGNGFASSNALMAGDYQAPTIEAAQVRAPSQNNIDLSGSFNRLINGTPGANPFLDQSIQGAIGQNRLGFQQLQDDSTKNLMQNIMPSIRSNSVLAGQYGGSRQGIAEGNAIGAQQTELARAAAQFGQNATNAAVGAKAGAYDADMNRALSATQGLSAQQYGVAQQDAAARQAADNSNVQALLATRGQNSSNIATGINLQQGVLNAANGYSNSDLSRLGMQSGILAPFLNAGAQSSTSGTSSGSTNSTTKNETTGNVTQPLYSNTAGNVLGGAMLGGQLSGLLGGGATDYGAIRNSDGGGVGGWLGSLLGGTNGSSISSNGAAGNWNDGLSLGDQKLSIPSFASFNFS